MHENRNLFLFLIEINNMHHTRHIYQYPGPVFGAGAHGAAGAVFRDLEGRRARRPPHASKWPVARHSVCPVVQPVIF